MKNKLNKNLTNLRNFFELIYTTGSATREEVDSFLRETLKFVFNENALNVEDYEVNFHFLPSKSNKKPNQKLSKQQMKDNMLVGGFCAYVQADEADDRKFDVYFPQEMRSFKITTPFQCGKNRDYDEALDEYIERFGNYFNFIFTLLHEYSHIIQYITMPDIMAEADETEINHAKIEYATKKFMPNSKEKRLLLRLLENYFKASSYTCESEMDADEQATQYYTDILCQIINAEQNAELVDFLLANYQFVEHAHRSSKKHQYIFKPQLYETSARLENIYEGNTENKSLTAQIDDALTKLELEDC